MKFDAIDPANPSVLIDRKLGLGVERSGGITILKEGQERAFTRQAQCMKQNSGMTILYEVPNERVAAELRELVEIIFIREGAAGRFTVVVSP